DSVPIGSEHGNKVHNFSKGGLEGGKFGGLGADMNDHADDLDSWKFGGSCIGGPCPRPGDAELRFGGAGGVLRVSLGVDIGIDPDGDRCGRSGTCCNVAQGFEFGLALDVELVDACVKRKAHLLFGLADTGKDN